MKDGLILIYHRVIELSHDPHQIAVHPVRFAAQIQYLKENYTILSLRELIGRLKSGGTVKNCLAITFDDGYADNLYGAKPVLEKFQVPATFFITAGMIGSPREFWWDELERIFLAWGESEESADLLELEINQRPYAWNIKPGENSRQVFQEVHRLLKYLPGQEREKILDDLFYRRKLARNAGRQVNRVLDQAELLALASGGLMEIGSHTLTHPALIVESGERQWTEINDSTVILAGLLKEKISSFSYPYGQRRDIAEETMKMVKDAGYSCGIANIQANIDERSDLYLVPRRIIRNWDLPEFRQKMAEFLTPAKLSPTFIYSKSGSPEVTTEIKKYLNNIKPCARVIQPLNGKQKISDVLFVNHYDQKGGAAKQCYRLFDFLGKNKFNVNMLVKKKFSAHEKIKEITEMTWEVPVDIHGQDFLSGFQEQEGWVDVFHCSSFKLKQSAVFQKADVVHLHNLQKDYFSLAALPEITCLKPVIWTLHDTYSFTGHCANPYDCQRWESGCGKCPDLNTEVPLSKDVTAMLWQFKKIIYQYSDLAVVCPSQWLKTKLEKSILKDKEINLIHNGVDETIFKDYDKHEARMRLQLPGDKRILLFASPWGIKHKTKGGHFIQAIVKNLKKKNILTICVGASHAAVEDILTVPYIENEQQLAFYYAAADLFIYPSLADNCPLVVLEALSCGTPVVSFRTGGIPELVKHKETGYIARYKNIRDLARGVKFFLDNVPLMEKAGREARQSVLKQFTLKTMVEKYLELFSARYHRFYHTSHIVDESYKEKLEKLLINR